MDKKHRLDNIEKYPSAVKTAQRVLKEAKRHFPKEIDMHKVRTGKTVYYFNSKRRLNNKLKELDCEYDYAPPGEELSEKHGLR